MYKPLRGVFIANLHYIGTFSLGPRGLERKENSDLGAFPVDFPVIFWDYLVVVLKRRGILQRRFASMLPQYRHC